MLRGHSCLDGYRLEIWKAEDDSTVQPLLVKSVKRWEESVELNASELGHVSNYRLSLFSTASRNVSTYQRQEKEKLPNLEILRESSLPVETSFTLGPLAPANLRLESSSPTSLKVKWDPAPQEHEKYSYIVTTNSTSQGIKVHGNNSATISKLGSGQIFRVSVASTLTTVHKCFKSKSVFIEAATKPMPPTNLKSRLLANGHKMMLVWDRSTSLSVNRYELTMRSEDEYQRQIVDIDQSEPTVTFLAPMTMDIDYKINVYSLFEHGGVLVRSEPLHARVRNGDRAYWFKVQQASKSMSNLNMQESKKHQWKSSTDLNRGRLWKSSAIKENSEQSIDNAYEEKDAGEEEEGDEEEEVEAEQEE